MGRKIIFLDIDGTLTEAGSNVPPRSAIEAVRETQKKEIMYFCVREGIMICCLLCCPLALTG